MGKAQFTPPLLAIAIMMTSSTALAEGFYAGVGLGQSTLDPHSYSGVTTRNADDNDTSKKIFAGYAFNDLLSVELGYTDLGKTSLQYLDNSWLTVDMDTNVITAFAKITAPTSFAIKPFIKAGAAKLEHEDNVVGVSLKKNKTNFAWGLGAQYDISNALSVQLEYEDFGDIGSTDANALEPYRLDDSTNTSVSLTYRF